MDKLQNSNTIKFLNIWITGLSIYKFQTVFLKNHNCLTPRTLGPSVMAGIQNSGYACWTTWIRTEQIHPRGYCIGRSHMHMPACCIGTLSFLYSVSKTETYAFWVSLIWQMENDSSTKVHVHIKNRTTYAMYYKSSTHQVGSRTITEKWTMFSMAYTYEVQLFTTAILSQ
jgi:hypothetical protein